MNYKNTIYEVKAIHGNNHLGGEDLTTSLINYVKQRLPIISITPRQDEKIREQCEQAKHQLSFLHNTSIFLENFYNDQDFNIPISRTTFINLNLPFFNKIEEYIKYILQDTGLSINKVVFIGGTTRTPYFVQVVQHVLGNNVPILNNIDPDQTVSIGACLQAAILTEQIQNKTIGDTLLLDIIPFSIGIETEFGIMNTIISKWSSIPISKSQIFTNVENNIDHIKINVYQGERKFVKDNILLGTFTLQELDNKLDEIELKHKWS
jgi:molecular chaperone DnaK (HSP70)